MQNDNCRRYEQAISEESAIDGTLRQHAAACPRCRALAAAAALAAPRLDAPSDDALAPQLRALAADAASRHRARRARQRWFAPALIGAGTCLFTVCVWLALLAHAPPTNGPVLPAAPPVPSAGLNLPPLPAPSPAAVGAVLLACLLWIAATVAVARRRSHGWDRL